MNYRDLKELVAQSLQNDKVKALIPSFIEQGQKLLERKLRLRSMETFYIGSAQNPVVTLASGVNVLALPSDYIELIHFSLISGTSRYPLFDRFSARCSIDSIPFTDTTNKGLPTRITRRGDNLAFNYYTDKAYDYEIGYFKKLTTLTNEADTNWWTTDAFDAILYASLYCASPVLPLIETSRGFMADPRITAWAHSLDNILTDLIHVDNKERLSGSPKRTRYSD